MVERSTTKRVWSRDEFILALDLYHRIEFGRINKTNPDIIKLAQFVGRTPSSIGMRLANFANCDPKLKERGVKGLDGAIKLCQPIWDEFEGIWLTSEKKPLKRESIFLKQATQNRPCILLILASGKILSKTLMTILS